MRKVGVFILNKKSLYDAITEDGKHLGEFIKEYRKAARFTQKQLAQKLNKAESTVRMWELGKNTPSLDTLKEVGEVLDIPLGELLIRAGYLTEFRQLLEGNLYKPYNPPIPTFGEAIEKLRRENYDSNLDQFTIPLSDISKETNIPEDILYRIEKGEDIQLTVTQLLDLAKALDVTFAYLYLLSSKGSKLLDQDILKNIINRLQPLPASYIEANIAKSFEEFYEEEKKLTEDAGLKEDYGEAIYNEIIFANEINQLMLLHALSNPWSNSPELQYLLNLSDIQLDYKGRKLSLKDKQKILKKIEEIEETFEYQN